MDTSTRICRQFARRGSCRYPNCKFRHERDTWTPKKSQVSERTKDFRAWKNTANRRCGAHISSDALDVFFTGARSLMDKDAGSMQDAICYMAEEHGLKYIQQLVERDFQLLPPQVRRAAFESQMLPFLETISHPKVLSSLVAEHALGTIYNFIYGIGGTRAVGLISSICSVLVSIPKENDTRAQWLEITLAVFLKILFVNSTAFIQEELKEQAVNLQDILSAMDTDEMAGKLRVSHRHLNQLLSRFETGAQMPFISRTGKQSQVITFTPLQDPPGGRHDNDHADISAIQILPTLDEISSSRPEYLPERDPSRWHVGGIQGVLARNFRLLREDSIGQLRDSIHLLIRQSQGELAPDESRQRNQLRTNVYSEAKIVESRLHNECGFVFSVEFPQLSYLRHKSPADRLAWWTLSKRLQDGALVCLTIDYVRMTFCRVVLEQRRHLPETPKEGPQVSSLWSSAKKATITLATVNSDEITVQSVLENYCNRPFSIVEFPGVLLASFEPTLRALQRMKQANYLPFESLLVPPAMDKQGSAVVLPPVYALSHGFRFNLRCLMKDDSDFFVDPGIPSDISELQNNSILDKAQANALVHSLQHCISLIQGPPGTGKSFTGIALVKVLLDNKNQHGGDIGPILCVSYTNHALDQLLVALLDRNITQNIVRIGSRSKAEKLCAFNLREVSNRSFETRGERYSLGRLSSQLHRIKDDFAALNLNQIPARKILSYLRENYQNHFRQLFGIDEDDFKSPKVKNPRRVIRTWLTSGVRSEAGGRPFEELIDVHVYDMSRPERERVHQRWMEELKASILHEAIELVLAHTDGRRELDRTRNESDLRCLSEADVVGVTTSGLARHLDMLRKLQVRVMLCEEAGEVLEAHLLTALLPSVEHIILIGDHLQLRPQVQNYGLSRENHDGGDRYSLDVSLFERLVEPKCALGSGLPFVALETQRRMHPSIARLVRDTLYHGLQDADNVCKYPEVSGMRKRLFWLDHRVQEEKVDEHPETASHWNNYEIEMTVALVNHLVSQGAYRSGDIAVLTPYLGQLHRLRQRFDKLFSVYVDERDLEELEKAGLDMEIDAKPSIRSSLLKTLRVASIDNFQGEEAKVVVISLVRSNPQKRCGFLRTPNRINVLLSRAQHGMYIIGNSETSVHIPMWEQVVQILEEDKNIGLKLELQCPRHPETLITVSEPSHFVQFSPEGGLQPPVRKAPFMWPRL